MEFLMIRGQDVLVAVKPAASDGAGHLPVVVQAGSRGPRIQGLIRTDRSVAQQGTAFVAAIPRESRQVSSLMWSDKSQVHMLSLLAVEAGTNLCR
jgi:hypothetical protein